MPDYADLMRNFATAAAQELKPLIAEASESLGTDEEPVAEGSAAYGEWPLSGGTAAPSFQQTALARIRRRWHDRGPLSALENAMEIVRAYNGGSARVRRAA
jgi:hypothetical protein